MKVLTVVSCGAMRSTTARKLRSNSSTRAFGMVDRVDDLLVEQARVGGVQHGAEAGDGVEQFEMAVRVPRQAGDAVAGFDAEALQGVGGLRRARQALA